MLAVQAIGKRRITIMGGSNRKRMGSARSESKESSDAKEAEAITKYSSVAESVTKVTCEPNSHSFSTCT